MDIEFLLWLQAMREASPGVIQAIFRFLGSPVAGAVVLVVPCVTYWCVDKRRSMFALFAYTSSTLLNQLFKAAACLPRPWVRDLRVTPEPSAIPAASGYSFPSGHTQASASMLVGLGWQWRSRRWPLVLALAFTALVAFSRTYLGVHAPQDVLVGFLEGVVVIALTARLLAWVEAKEGRDLRICGWGLALLVPYLAFVTLKAYPAATTSAELPVDPAEMIEDCYKSAGVWVGVLVGWVVERRVVRFSTDGLDARRVALRMAVGVALLALAYAPVGSVAIALVGELWGQLVRHAAVFFALTAGAPAAFKALERRGTREVPSTKDAKTGL